MTLRISDCISIIISEKYSLTVIFILSFHSFITEASTYFHILLSEEEEVTRFFVPRSSRIYIYHFWGGKVG
jgi:hypothetical protein